MKLIDKLTGRASPPDGEPSPEVEVSAEGEAAVSAEADTAAESAAAEAPPARGEESDAVRLREELAALREEAETLRARLANAENRRAAPPAPPGGGDGEFYTPQDVRRMSPGEVRARMPAIRASMEKWK